MKHIRSIIIAALAAGSITALAACGDTGSSASGSAGDGGAGPGVTSTTASDKPQTTLKVGIIPSSGLAPMYLGVQNGYFTDQGLKLDLVPGATAAALIAQTISGQLNITFAPSASIIAADANGAKLKAIASVGGKIDPAEPSAAIMVKSGSSIKSPKDLAGKKVAVIALKSELDVLLHTAVKNAGADEKSVHSVQIPFPEMLPALKSGRVDAIVTTEPFMTIAKQAGTTNIYDIESKLIPNVTTSVFAATEDYIKKNPEVIKAFQAANAKSTLYAKANVDQARALLPKITSMKPALAKVVKLGLIYDPDVDVTSVEKMSQLMQDLGYVKDVPPAAQLVQPRTP
jgi:NitT/TauT family transport system substrate-binding protein